MPIPSLADSFATAKWRAFEARLTGLGTPGALRILERARTGEFHDFHSKVHTSPKLALCEELERAELPDVARETFMGWYDF